VTTADVRTAKGWMLAELEELQCERSPKVDNDQNATGDAQPTITPFRATGETMTSIPPIIQEQRASLALLRKKQLEAEMHRLLTQENDHRRQAERYRVRATHHERRALAQRI